MDYFLENHEILIEDVALRGRGSYAGYMLPVGIKEDVVEWVCDELNHDAGPQWVTRMGLQQHIRETYDIVISCKRICKPAGVWDLDWGAKSRRRQQASAPPSACFAVDLCPTDGSGSRGRRRDLVYRRVV